MLSRTIFFVVLVIVLIVPSGAQASAHAVAQRMFSTATLHAPIASDRVLVRLADGAAPPSGATHLFGEWYAAPVRLGTTPQQALARSRAQANVIAVAQDYRIQIDGAAAYAAPLTRSNAPSISSAYQWHLLAAQAPAVWHITTGGGDVVVVGIATSAPDMGCHSFVAPYNAITDEASLAAAQDDNGHGTHVAGTIAQCNNRGMASGVTLMPIKAYSAAGSCLMYDVAKGIAWASSHGADVINLSLGASCTGVGTGQWPDCSSDVVNDAIALATAADVVVIAAAGNFGEPVVDFPANHPDVVAVAALDALQQRTRYTNTGSAIDIAAPGGDLFADANGDGYADGVYQETLGSLCGAASEFATCPMQGTSMAAPHVSGAAALLRSAAPSASSADIRMALERSAADLGDAGVDVVYGHGALQVHSALHLLLPHIDEGTAHDLPATPQPNTPLPHATSAIYLPLLSR